MSKGLGSVQDWITSHLSILTDECTIAEMAVAFCEENDVKQRLRRSARHSLTRALRGLVKAGVIKRILLSHQVIFRLTKPPKPAFDEYKEVVAYHEAGHAVIARARQLPISLLTIIGKGRAAGYVGMVGHGYYLDKRRKRYVRTTNDPSLDWAGNKVPPRREVSQYEHESEILMSIAGGMAERMHCNRNDLTPWKDWKSAASNSDIRIARDHRGEIERPETWEHYETLTHEMLLKYWPMVQAVAAALMRRKFLDAREVDSICGRVVRRQHLKAGKVKPL
jgi:hypothetical protein